MNAVVPKIRFTNVYKSFGKKKVLQGVNLDVMPQESVVIIGGSGTGKSVLVKSVLGIVKPDSGTIEIEGRDVSKLSHREREQQLKKFGMLFQGGALFDSMRIWQNIAFGLIQGSGMDKKEARVIALEKLKQVGLTADVAELFPSELSGGMQKRVALARAIATKPDVIFFDEPTTGLDPIMADVINELIVKCVKDLGATALTITHDMHSVRKIADKVAMLYEGKILWQGTVEELDSTDDAYVQQFVSGMSTAVKVA
jgi:phospholipid/cholesterol/gamma-HCH transport system ATP-binding protein